MGRIKTNRTQGQFDIISEASNEMGETNDCSVKAVAIVTGVSYEEAHEVLKEKGRVNKRGASPNIIFSAIDHLGFEVRKYSESNIRDKMPKAAAEGLTNLTTHHPERFKNAWADVPTLVILTKKHISAFVDGAVHDWAVGKKLFIEGLYSVTPKKDLRKLKRRVPIEEKQISAIKADFKKAVDLSNVENPSAIEVEFDMGGGEFQIIRPETTKFKIIKTLIEMAAIKRGRNAKVFLKQPCDEGKMVQSAEFGIHIDANGKPVNLGWAFAEGFKEKHLS